ncbi:MAG: translation initiation factor IF-2 [Holosporales bacterium]|nr:translation initiation factor IF-2 [Holosporales bacterium]
MEESSPKKTLVLSRSLGARKVDVGQVRQSFSRGRSKTVSVEVRRKRFPPGGTTAPAKEEVSPLESARPLGLTDQEWETRLRVVKEGIQGAEALEGRRDLEAGTYALLSQTRQEEARQQEGTSEEDIGNLTKIAPSPTPRGGAGDPKNRDLSEEAKGRLFKGRKSPPSVARRPKIEVDQRRVKISVNTALNEQEERLRSQAALQRARQKIRKQHTQDTESAPQVKEVVVPEAISVQELANRMAVRSAEVIKTLMRLGMAATINQVLDADTAELIVGEFGHNVRRVSEADIEQGLKGDPDLPEDLLPRPPVVTVMGHVDHGKTSLLDVLRRADTALHEAGGITQHIGAYQIQLKDGRKITFIDTPGHAAFTEMRARGAHVTDIVVLVVAADDGVKDQTIEAIHHAQAAAAPIVVAINKVDKPGADPERIRQELLGHEVVVEAFGGEVLNVEVSAKNGENLEKLAEAILAQAELLDLKANPHRTAEGVVIESELRQGLGPVATILIQRGTLKKGDIFVAGSVSGRVRALLDAHGTKLSVADPGMPVEVMGFNATPAPGDDFVVVGDEARAKSIAQFRERKRREVASALKARGSVEQMFAKRASEEKRQTLSVVVKADAQGSVEAIRSNLERLSNDEVQIHILHAGIGSITESDVALARTSRALILGFNVRANPQARESAQQEGTELHYYSIIYDLIDTMKARLSGLLAPELREKILGTAEIRQIFEAKKVGKIAGCMVTEGLIRRSARVRLFREGILVQESAIKSLRRIREEVNEVMKGFECGLTLIEGQDIREGDSVECFEVEEIARQFT